MNGGFARDAVIAALIISAVIHVGLMFWARPMIMTEVLPSSLRSTARPPMRVTKAESPPDPLKLEAVEDIKADASAPDVSEAIASLPAAEPASPTAVSQRIEVPSPPAPEVISRDVPPDAPLPPPTSNPSHSIPSRPPQMTATGPAPAPSAASLAPSVQGITLPSAPVFESPSFASAAIVIPPTSKLDKKTASVEEKKEEMFEPVDEVMPEVDESIVKKEKEAVRALVDSDGAKEMSGVVDASMKVMSEGEWLYFNVNISPRAALRVVPKDFVVLIDASGSIGKDRMRSIRRAAKRILRSAANTGDRFNLVAFRDRFSYAFRSWNECDVESFDAADRWLDSVAPFGRTDVFSTISSVLTLPRDPKRPLIALVVTDGDANAGVSDTESILSRFAALNDGLVSVYMYGVKEASNRRLIDFLTRGNRGESFIFEGSRFRAGEGIEPLSERFRDPVLTDLRVVFSSQTSAQAYPRLLRNLYRGGSVDIIGRVPSGTKEIAFSVKGLSGSQAYESFFTFPVASQEADDALPSTWHRERSVGTVQPAR